MRNFPESIRFTSLSLARWGLFCFLTVLFAATAYATPNTLVFNGQLITSDATRFTEYQDCTGTLQIGTKEGTVFRSLKEYRPTFKVQRGGAFEVSINDVWLRDLDYSSNDYYLKFKINATTPPTPEFTSDRIAAAPYAFMAYNQKGGPVYAVGSPALVAGNARVKGEMQGSNFGIKGRGNYEYNAYHKGPWRSMAIWATTMELKITRFTLQPAPMTRAITVILPLIQVTMAMGCTLQDGVEEARRGSAFMVREVMLPKRRSSARTNTPGPDPGAAR
jgi:hypothetical protein